MAHAYHHHCGCFSCCRVESAHERAAEAAEPYIEGLKSNWSVLSEAMGELTDEEMKRMAISLAASDDSAFAAVMRSRIDTYVDELIEGKMDQRGCDIWTAASGLADVYEVTLPKRTHVGEAA